MTDIVGVIRADRWLDEVVIAGSVANLDGDGSIYVSMPPGLEHLAIMECLADIGPLATVRTNIELAGCRWSVIRLSDDALQDLLGVSRWQLRSAVAASTYVSPDPLVEWKATERVHLSFPELDTDASPTGDFAVVIKTVRVRPIEASEQPRPIRLVR